MNTYKKTTLTRNVLLVLFSLALIAVLLKLVFAAREISLVKEAQAYYEKNNLVQAEERYARAAAIDVISYGDPQMRSTLSALTPIRTELESLASQVDAAQAASDFAAMRGIYTSYAKLKQAQQPNPKEAAFFQTISARLGIENKLSAFFTQEKTRAIALMESNLKKRNYENESFVSKLIAIPDAYYGGKKDDELTALFKNYDRKKFKDIKENRDFAEVVAMTAKSLRTYKQESFQADWLVDLIEQYGKQKLLKESKLSDVADFIEHAKVLEQLRDVLPEASDVFTLITDKIDSFMKYADDFANRNLFERALALYQELGAYTKTGSYIADLEERWLGREPIRLLQKQYPDKTFHNVAQGENKWGASAYMAALADDQTLYYAAKLEDGTVRMLEMPLDRALKVKQITVPDAVTESDRPVILVEAASANRKSTYIGYEVLQAQLSKLFEIEADGLSVEKPGTLLLTNAVGDGENHTAPYTFINGTLTFAGEKPTVESGTTDPSSSPAEGASPPTETAPEQQPPASPAELVLPNVT
ncbi:MAG: hypothetical protein ACM32O_18245, partial [Clostridia bacterium]